jgi:hypothetical protein
MKGDEEMHRSMNTTQCALVTTVLLAGGCASSELSQERLTETLAAVEAVEELDQAEDPEVSLHLKYARDQLAAVRRLSDDHDRKEAQRMLERAHADAQLALALARTERSREEARQAWSEVEELRKQ